MQKSEKYCPEKFSPPLNREVVKICLHPKFRISSPKNLNPSNFDKNLMENKFESHCMYFVQTSS